MCILNIDKVWNRYKIQILSMFNYIILSLLLTNQLINYETTFTTN